MSKRNYKDEYNKFQKHKSKYRAKLNKYNGKLPPSNDARKRRK